MRRLLALAIAIALCGCAKNNEEARKQLAAYSWVGAPDSIGQIVVLKGHAYGLVDTNGNVLVEPAYSMIGPYVQSVRRVQKGWDRADYYSEPLDATKEGAIDSLGKVIVPAKYDAVDGFWRSDDFTLVSLDGKVGVYHINGKKVASPAYDQVAGVYANKVTWEDAQPSKKKRRGRRNADESQVTEAPPLFDSFGLAEVQRDRLYGWLDSSGTERIAPKYDELESPRSNKDSAVWYRKDGKWGLVSLSGKELTPAIYDGHLSWNGTHCIVHTGDRYGIVSTRGRETQPLVYRSIRFLDSRYCVITRDETSFLEGLASVTSSKVFIEPMYRDIVGPHADERFIVQSNDNYKYGVVMTTNKAVIPCEYDAIRWGLDGAFGYYHVRSERLEGFLTSKAKLLGGVQWDNASSFHNGLAFVSNSSSGYLLNYSGKLKEISRRK